MTLAGVAGPALAQVIACTICVPPLIVQIQQRKFASSVLILSTLTLNLMQAINIFIWSSNDTSTWWDGQVFCDIEIRLLIALETSISGAVTCIFRQLSLVFTHSAHLQTKAQKRWTKLIELTLCVAAPLARMALFYIVQPDRYLITELHGCVWTVDSSWPGVVLMYSWMIIISLIALGYTALTAFRVFKHSRRTSTILGRSENQYNSLRIVRLHCFAVLLFLTALPFQIYTLYYSLPRDLEPFSWSRVHPPDWSERIFMQRTPQYGIWRMVPFLAIFYSCGIAILVGLAPDAIDTYKTWLVAVRKWAKRVRGSASMHLSSNNHIPARHHSLDLGRSPQSYELEVTPGSWRH